MAYAEKYNVGETWINKDPKLDWHVGIPIRITDIDKENNKIFFELLNGEKPLKDYFQVGSLVSDTLQFCAPAKYQLGSRWISKDPRMDFAYNCILEITNTQGKLVSYERITTPPRTEAELSCPEFEIGSEFEKTLILLRGPEPDKQIVLEALL